MNVYSVNLKGRGNLEDLRIEGSSIKKDIGEIE
jgi:hypothetical protein